MARAVFGLSAEDVERLQQAIMSSGDEAEKVINNNYLYFPQEAEGVHFQGKVPNDFMQHGVDAQYDNVVNNLLEKLQNNFK